MTSASITSDIGQSLDIHGDFSSAIAFNNIFILNDFADAINIITIKIITVHCIWQIHFIENLACG